MPDITIRPATPAEAPTVHAILTEAANRLISINQPLWRLNELAEEKIAADVAAGQVHIACVDDQAAGCIRFQLEDPFFWPDDPPGEAAYVHRLAVRRKHAGGHVSAALLTWAKQRTREIGRRYLRLDTDATRPSLCAVYDRNGFRRHSKIQQGPYLVWRYECEV
jgi:GNAT superfamily N-acetyltransferase